MSAVSAPTVPCAVCGDPIDARRAVLPITHGCCVACNGINLTTTREARENLPQYETAVWERGGTLD